MTAVKRIAQHFLAALAANDAAAFEAVLASDAGLRWVDMIVIISLVPDE